MTEETLHTRIWQILDPVDSAAFEVVAASAPADEAIAAIEAAAGFPVPADFLALSKKQNGLCVMARPEAWPEAEQYDVGPAWTFWRGVVLLGIDDDELPEWASMGEVLNRLIEAEVTGVLPLLTVVGDGGRVWGVRADGRMVLVEDYDETTELDDSLADIYAAQIAELIQRQQDMAARPGRPRKGRI